MLLAIGFFFSFLFCLFQFCDVATLAIIHPQEELAKFGYRSKRKVEIFKESNYILATRNVLSKYGNFRKFCPWDLPSLAHYFHDNPCVWVALDFFCHQVSKIRPKETLIRVTINLICSNYATIYRNMHHTKFYLEAMFQFPDLYLCSLCKESQQASTLSVR